MRGVGHVQTPGRSAGGVRGPAFGRGGRILAVLQQPGGGQHAIPDSEQQVQAAHAVPGHVFQLQAQLGQGQAVDAQIRRQPRFRRQRGRVRLHGGAVRQDGIDLFARGPVHAVQRV